MMMSRGTNRPMSRLTITSSSFWLLRNPSLRAGSPTSTKPSGKAISHAPMRHGSAS
jgi:hypothetical protein